MISKEKLILDAFKKSTGLASAEWIAREISLPEIEVLLELSTSDKFAKSGILGSKGQDIYYVRNPLVK